MQCLKILDILLRGDRIQIVRIKAGEHAVEIAETRLPHSSCIVGRLNTHCSAAIEVGQKNKKVERKTKI